MINSYPVWLQGLKDNELNEIMIDKETHNTEHITGVQAKQMNVQMNVFWPMATVCLF